MGPDYHACSNVSVLSFCKACSPKYFADIELHFFVQREHPEAKALWERSDEPGQQPGWAPLQQHHLALLSSSAARR